MVALRTTLLTSVAVLASYVNAYGQIAQVVDANNFCLFLPPSDSANRNIADTEWNAQAFCMGSTPFAKNAGKLDSGFIQSAHYLATDKYVQVTGKINPSKARLDATDEGGQYDIKAPKGSSCYGWKYYVNLIEPAINTYCMRCCNDDRSCNRGISEKGCAHIIPGDYSGPEIPSAGKATTTTTKKAPATTTKTTIIKTTTKATPVNLTTKAEPVVTTTNASESTPNTTTSTTVIQTVAPVATPSSNASPIGNSTPITPDTSSSSQPGTMLGQKDKVSEQSVSGGETHHPSMISMTVAIVVMALVFQH